MDVQSRASADKADIHHISGFETAEGICQVVDASYRGAREGDQEIA